MISIRARCNRRRRHANYSFILRRYTLHAPHSFSLAHTSYLCGSTNHWDMKCVRAENCARWKFHCLHFSRRSHSQPLHGCCSWYISAPWKNLRSENSEKLFSRRTTFHSFLMHNNSKRLSIIIYHHRITNRTVPFAQSFSPLRREKIRYEQKNCAWNEVTFVKPIKVWPLQHCT